jgi:hypothetical protein
MQLTGIQCGDIAQLRGAPEFGWIWFRHSGYETKVSTEMLSP